MRQVSPPFPKPGLKRHLLHQSLSLVLFVPHQDPAHRSTRRWDLQGQAPLRASVGHTEFAAGGQGRASHTPETHQFIQAAVQC